MAITTNTFTINAGFARSSILTQLESAFTWLGWHGDTHTGICTGISVYSGGGDTNAAATYEDARQLSTSGVGTDISFYITRDSGGLINRVMVNRPGYGYTDGEVVTVSSEEIGGSSNGASDLTVTVNVEGGETPVGYGGVDSFYDSDLEVSSTYPWAVQRHTIQNNKKYGDTYRAFQVAAGSASAAHTLKILTGSAFHPYDTSNTADKGLYYGNSFRGRSDLDIMYYAINNSPYNQLTNASTTSSYAVNANLSTISVSSSYDLELHVYRSSIDPNFAVFCYKHPTLSSTHLTDNTKKTLIFHNFTTNIWDYDNVFLSGLTEISPVIGNTTTPEIVFRTFYANTDTSIDYTTMRGAETGYVKDYLSAGDIASYTFNRSETTYQASTYPRGLSNIESRFYHRNHATDFKGIGTDGNFNAVIKGIPLNAKMIPCPYYLPDDFVLINFDYATPAANIQQGDTVTISGSEVYTVITGSYNQTDRTRGILFCARKV